MKKKKPSKKGSKKTMKYGGLSRNGGNRPDAGKSMKAGKGKR